jgi:hypothetical protein
MAMRLLQINPFFMLVTFLIWIPPQRVSHNISCCLNRSSNWVLGLAPFFLYRFSYGVHRRQQTPKEYESLDESLEEPNSSARRLEEQIKRYNGFFFC